MATQEAFALLRVARHDEVAATVLVEIAPYLAHDDVTFVEQWVLSARIGSISIPTKVGRTSNLVRSYLLGRLPPALARVGEMDRAMAYARLADEDREGVVANLRIGEVTGGVTRTRALLHAFTPIGRIRDVFRQDQIDEVARAIAQDEAAAAAAWPRAVAWARARPRHEAIEILASTSPVAAVCGGSDLSDEIFRAVERALRWWP